MTSHPTADPGPQDQRHDRRRRDLPLWHPRRLRGRRMHNRRGEQDARPYFVDRVSGLVFAQAALLLVLTVTDGLFTFALLEHGGFEEANPVMRALLERGTTTFFVGKYLLTALFLPFAVVMYRYRLFGTRLRVGHFLPVVTALYLALIVYQVQLWRDRNSPQALGPPSALEMVLGEGGWLNVSRWLPGGGS